MINSFTGEYYFLSNFYPAPVTYEGITYQNNEAAFQAQKVLDIEERKKFASLNPSEAKKKGRHVKLRPDWEEVKAQIMYKICYEKFNQNEDIGEKLVCTANQELEEGNTWGDRIWGTVDGVGENLLGKILMAVRDQLLWEDQDWRDYM